MKVGLDAQAWGEAYWIYKHCAVEVSCVPSCREVTVFESKAVALSFVYR